MASCYDTPTSLQTLQDKIYREKVLRARAMTPEERMAEAMEQSDLQFGMMLAGAMAQLGTTDEEEGWAEVRRWVDRLNRARDYGRYTTSDPRAA
jgi:hypothetical protein